MNKQDKGKCTLIITGISSKRAKELAEEFASVELMGLGDRALKRIEALESALDTAITGLQWWADSDSKYTSENDQENIKELKLTLGKDQ